MKFLTAKEEQDLSKACQKALHQLRDRLGAAVDEKAMPEVVIAAARARRWDVSKIEFIRKKFVESCTPWAIDMSRRVFRRQIARSGALELDDIIQSAMIGLMAASLRYKPGRGKWSTYCTWWIRQSIGRSLRQEQNIIRVPEACQTSLRQNLLDKDESARVNKIIHSHSIPFPEGLPDREHRTVPDEESIYVELKALLEPRELEIMLRRFGLRGRAPQTLGIIGVALNLSRERIRQIQNIALEKLRWSKILREELNDHKV